MTIRIEIHERPERAIFWAEVEVGGMVARRREVTSPIADGLAVILRLVHEAAAAMDPRIAPPPANVWWDAQGDPTEWPQPGDDVVRYAAGPEGADIVDAPLNLAIAIDVEPGAVAGPFEPSAMFYVIDLDTLRAEAEAAGVRVDGRWGEERLRQEIAAAGDGESAAGRGGGN